MFTVENNVRVLLDTSIPVLPKVNSNHFDVVFHIGEDVGFGSPTNAKPQARRTMDLKGKTAIISGGGRDLGRAFRLDILRQLHPRQSLGIWHDSLSSFSTFYL